MSESKPLAETIAREHFYCSGPWNEPLFVRDYALFIILRKQCLRYLKTGQINHGLALNNTVIALNSFGKTAVNRIVKILFDEDQARIMSAILHYLGVIDADHFRSPDAGIVDLLAKDGARFNLEH